MTTNDAIAKIATSTQSIFIGRTGRLDVWSFGQIFESESISR
jgi:hypothetical protein